MDGFGRFFLPGPTEVRPEVLAAMTRAVIGHRGRDLSSLLEEVDPRLRRLFRTERPVYVASSSATGLMEAGVRNGVRRRALALVNGAFSGRFRDLVTDCGREVESYEVPWGEAHDPAEVERRLRAGGIDAVTVVHSETSTGVLNPRDLKLRLARELAARFHGAAAAEQAVAGWNAAVRGQGDTAQLPLNDVAVPAEGLRIGALLTAAGLTPSNSEANRKLKERAVRIDGVVVEDAALVLVPGFEGMLAVGKRNFARVRLVAGG